LVARVFLILRQDTVQHERPVAIVSGLPTWDQQLWSLSRIDRYRELPFIEAEKPFSPRELAARVYASVRDRAMVRG